MDIDRNNKAPPVAPAVRKLLSIGAKWRFVAHGPVLVKTPPNGEFEPKTPAYMTVEVFDGATGELFACGRGDNEELALADAATKAMVAPKPKTLAQKADEAMPVEDQIALHEKRLAELRAQAAAEVSPSVSPGVRTISVPKRG